MNIKEELKILIKNALNTDISLEEITIEIPAHKDHGDYATNVAMKLSKKLGKKSIDIANDIVNNIDKEKILNIEVAGPGFINFFLKKDYLFDNVKKVLKEEENYGRTNIGNNEKVNVEFVSVNPTGIIHLGHARGAAYGDSLCNILDFAGYKTTREYYVNDAGNQMFNMAKSVRERYKELCGLPFQMEENYYYGKEIIDVAKQIYDKHGDKFLNEDIKEYWKIGLEYFLNQIKEDLKLARVHFDVWSSEQAIRDRGIVEECLNKLKKDGRTYEKEDALWLRTTDYKDDKDRVLIKNDGTYTYFMPDIAYHYDKLSRGYDKLIDVLGADHYGYIERLKASVEMLGNDSNKLEVKIVQMVRVIKDNQEYKISKRTGNTITMRDLLNEVGVDALRYFFVNKSLDTQIDFDLDLALSNSNDNPVYYIQYAHARICSILNSYQGEINNDIKFETITSDAAYNVLEKIYQMPEIVSSAAIKRQPHLIATYAYELAGLFHSYYAQEKIITEDEKRTKERIMLIKAVKITIANALKLIGVEPKTNM